MSTCIRVCIPLQSMQRRNSYLGVPDPASAHIPHPPPVGSASLAETRWYESGAFLSQSAACTPSEPFFIRELFGEGTDHRHLPPFARSIFLVPKALVHNVRQAKATPEKDTHLSVLA